MGLLGKIWVKLGLDNSELDKGFKDSEKSANGFQNSLKKIGGMMAAAFSVTAVIGFAKASVAAYNDSALAAAKLGSIIKSTGSTIGLTSGELISYAEQLQRVTMYEDDATIHAMSLMATFKSVKGDIFKQAIASAQDLATILRSDLQGAVLQLGKALQNPEIGLMMLRRSGISFSAQQTDSIKQLVKEGRLYEAQLRILAEVQSQFGGAAKAAALTAGGSWAQMFNQLNNVMEQIGSIIEGSTGAVKLMTAALEQTATVMSSKILTGWQKLAYWVSKASPAGWISGQNQKLSKDIVQAAENAKGQMEANRKVVDAEMLGIKNIGDAKVQLFKASHALISKEDAYNKKAYANYSTINEMREASLQSYIAAKNTELDAEQFAAAEEKKAAEATAAAALKEQMGIDGTIKRYQFLVSEIEKKILAATDRTVIEALQNEKAGLENLIKVWQMNTSEAKAYYAELEKIEAMRATNDQFKLTVPKGRASVDAKGAALVAPTDEKLYADFYAQQIKDAEKAIDQMEAQKDRMVDIAAEMNRAITYAISDGLQSLVESLVMTGKVDIGSVVAALLTPFGNMLIQLGEMAIGAGVGMAAIEASFSSMNPAVAIGAGVAMVALGSLIKAGVATIGRNKGASSLGSASSFSGGNSYSGSNAFGGMALAGTPIKVEISGKLAGQDIVLAGDNYKKNRLR